MAGSIELEMSTADFTGRFMAALAHPPAPGRADFQPLSDLFGFLPLLIQLQHAILQCLSVSHRPRLRRPPPPRKRKIMQGATNWVKML